MIEIRLGDQLVSIGSGDDLATGGASGIQYPSYPIDYVYVISASVLQRSIRGVDREAELVQMLSYYGVENPPQIITEWADGGDRSIDYVTKLPQALDDARGKENVLFLIHGFGNDVSAFGPWPGGSQEYRERMISIVEDIKAEGHHVIWGSLSYRLHGRSNPSAPYNQLLTKPTLKQINPQSVSNDQFIYDLYTLTERNKDLILSDGIHPDNRGKHVIRHYTAEILNKIIQGDTPPSPIEDYFGKRVIVNLGGEPSEEPNIVDVVDDYDSAGGASSSEGMETAVVLRTTEGDVLHGSSLVSLHSGRNLNNAGDVTTTGAVLRNKDVMNNCVFVNNFTQGTLSVKGIPNGLTGQLSIVAARDTTSDRTGVYTHKRQTKTLSGGYVAGQTIESITFDFTVENNEIVIDWVTDDGQTYAYICGIEVVFDENKGKAVNVESTNSFDTQSTLGSNDGASFNMLNMSKMFKDREGTQPVTNLADKVERINSDQDGVYLVSDLEPATITSYNGKPVVRFNNSRYLIQGYDTKIARPVIAHGTVGGDTSEDVLYFYTKDGTYEGRKWGFHTRDGQARVFSNDGDTSVVDVNGWGVYRNVYLNRVDDEITIDGVQSALVTQDETYADTDVGFSIGNYASEDRNAYSGIITHFVISDSPLEEAELTSMVDEHQSYLSI